MAYINVIFQYQLLVCAICSNCASKKSCTGMTKLLYKVKMMQKIRFVNITKDAEIGELGSAGDIIRIPPRYEAGRDQTDHAPLNDLHLHLLEPTTASATIASRSTCMSKNVLVNIDQKNWPENALHTGQALTHPPTSKERNCQHGCSKMTKGVQNCLCPD